MTENNFDWKKLQKIYNYSDEELENFRANPRKRKAITKLFSREITKKNLIIEVVSSHGCSARMKPGDRLIFRAMGGY